MHDIKSCERVCVLAWQAATRWRYSITIHAARAWVTALEPFVRCSHTDTCQSWWGPLEHLALFASAASASGKREKRERVASAAGPMEKKRGSSHQYGSLERTEWSRDINKPEDDIVQGLSAPGIWDNHKSNEDLQKEEVCFREDSREKELLQQSTSWLRQRNFLVDDVEFERLREKEEDKEMADFLKSKFPRNMKKTGVPTRQVPSRAQQTSSPFTKTGLTLLKECCGFTCSIM
ncbi:bMERB domain-containing protein 1 isoform X2 [Lates japonicus]|uniref:BMERB domain-containing protein 1 isoform X2 n=1 Tax=Lates japonicus TaxID=270547 RepID=A0AAD3N476_LATJO|nr:bMERB domain-containing protein 1 isoform X2 [Lates japonicus]